MYKSLINLLTEEVGVAGVSPLVLLWLLALKDRLAEGTEWSTSPLRGLSSNPGDFEAPLVVQEVWSHYHTKKYGKTHTAYLTYVLH